MSLQKFNGFLIKYSIVKFPCWLLYCMYTVQESGGRILKDIYSVRLICTIVHCTILYLRKRMTDYTYNVILMKAEEGLS